MIKRQTIISSDENVGQCDHSCFSCGNIKWCSYLGEIISSFLIFLYTPTIFLYTPTISLLGKQTQHTPTHECSQQHYS